jgi:hypothetical protein
MQEQILSYLVPEIPDPLYSKYQMAAGGDVLSAVGQDFENLLRTVANIPPRSISVTIRFVFDPQPKNADIQSRLSIYVIVRTHDKCLADNLRLMFERGPVARFYKFQCTGQLEAPRVEPQAVCEILRREDAVTPLHSPEFNDRIPEAYYTIEPFQPCNRNDYTNLDRVFGGIGEPVTIDICVEPADVSSELFEHTRYLSRLQSINQSWGRDQEEDLGIQDYLGDSDWRPTWKKSIRPLRFPDPLAEEILRFQQRFHESLRKPHLLFHIIVSAQTPAVAQLIGSLVADSAFEGGSYRLLMHSKGERLFDDVLRSVKGNRVSAIPVHESLFPGKGLTLYSGLAQLSRLATVEELTGAFRLPVAATSSPQCIRKNTDPPHEKEQDSIIFGQDKENLGLLRGIRPSVAVKHLFVGGTPGSAKTTNTLNIVLQLHQRGIPFLIIEPVKTEYRVQKTLKNSHDSNARQLAEDLEVYTPGNEQISPLRFNPVKRLPGISVDEKVDNVMACFQATMPLPGPLQAVLREALERVYEDHPDVDNPPIMADLVEAAERVLAEKGYSPETNSDIRAALEVRLGVLTRGSIGRVFQCRHSTPSIEDLMKVPAVIELDRLALDQACLLTLFLFMAIREYLKTLPKPVKDGPRYVIIIEEAHNIVGCYGEARASPDIADPKAFAAGYVCRLLAEVRALAIMVIIVDQFPSKIAPEVIKSTATKLELRQVAKEDREVIGASMLMNPMEINELARLNPGDAFLYTEGYHGPRRIKTINLHEQYDLSADVLNERIFPYIKGDAWFQKAALDRALNELGELKDRTDRFDNERLQLIPELAPLLGRQPRVLAKPMSEERERALADLRSTAYRLKNRLSDAYCSFLRNSYRRYLRLDGGCEVQDALVEEMRKNLVNRFESIIKPDVEKCLKVLGEFIRRCGPA